MLRGAIFDLDGTLGDTLPVCYAAFRRVLGERLGRRYSDREIHALFGPSEEGILSRLVPNDPDGALEDYLAAYREAHAACPQPFPGIRDVLGSLAGRGVALAVVTGKGPGSARISLDVFGLGGFFPIVEAGSAFGPVKADAMRGLLRRWSLPAGSVVGVGDSPSDVRAARTAGIASVAAAWAPGADVGALARREPDRLFEDVASLARWLDARAVQTISMQSP